MKNNINAIPPVQAMREAIQNIAVGPDRGRDISKEMAANVMQGVLDGEIDQIQVAIFLIALRMKRESMDEFSGIFEALNNNTDSVQAEVDDVIILADPFDGYVRNVTMTPFLPAVLAACGHHCVIHGVETVGPKHGVTTHKVIAAAGGSPLKSVSKVAQLLPNTKWAYVDQSQYSRNLFSMEPLRDTIVKRTALTTLERLLMPIKGSKNTHLVLGYVHKAYPDIYATIAKQAGYDSVLLLKGVEGGLAPALNKPLRRFFFEGDLPPDIEAQKKVIKSDFMSYSKSAAQISVANDKVNECLSIGLDVLNGQQSETLNIARNSLSLAAGQILDCHDPNLSLTQAVEKVQVCLDNGLAKSMFEDFLNS